MLSSKIYHFIVILIFFQYFWNNVHSGPSPKWASRRLSKGQEITVNMASVVPVNQGIQLNPNSITLVERFVAIPQTDYLKLAQAIFVDFSIETPGYQHIIDTVKNFHDQGLRGPKLRKEVNAAFFRGSEFLPIPDAAASVGEKIQLSAGDFDLERMKSNLIDSLNFYEQATIDLDLALQNKKTGALSGLSSTNRGLTQAQNALNESKQILRKMRAIIEEAEFENIHGADIDNYVQSIEYLSDMATQQVEIANRVFEINNIGCN